MTIEELAFKDRRTLAHLNEKDLLDIIEFLQDDRKQWINQFSKTHNESVEIQKENQELKKQLEDANEKIILLQASEPMLNYKKTLEETQQKEFIKYLENMLDNENDIFSVVRVKDALQKYKSIIGVSYENNKQ